MVADFKSIEEMEKYYYTEPLRIIAEKKGIPIEDLIAKTKQEILEVEALTKTNYPYQTDTTGALNYIYGAQLWSSICTEANAFGILPKKPYDKGGYRAITAAASTSSAGTSESGAVSDSAKPTLAAVNVGLKTLNATTDISEVLMLQEGKDDVATWGEMINYARDEFINRINRGLLVDNGTVASTNVESIDRVCSSYSELGGNSDGAGATYSANDLDIYGIDKDGGAGWTDAYVSHNSGTDRTFSLDLLDTVIDNCIPYWKGGRKNKVILTGYDTARRIAQLERPKEVYTADTSVQFGVNGVQTVRGKEAGIPVATYDGIPIICSNNVGKDTISRIYVLDLDHLWFAVARPVTYVESSDPLVVGFKKRGNFSMVGELVCTCFYAQGKVRDLK